MNKKIVTIFISMLLFATTISLAETINNNTTQNTPLSSTNTDWWPMFRHNSAHTGFSSAVEPDVVTHYRWINNEIGVIRRSSPAVVDGRLFIINSTGELFCLDAMTGKILWNNSIDAGYDISPAVTPENVYILSNDGKVYCFDTSNGLEVWNTTIGSVVYPQSRSSPTIYNGNIYIGSDTGNIYCLNGSTGQNIWSEQIGDSVEVSPAVTNGKVYVASKNSDWSGELYCFDALVGGSPLWVSSMSYAASCSPAVFDSMVYIASSWSDIFYCFNADNGSIIWNNIIGNFTASSPAVAYERIYFGASDGCVHCLDAYNGTKLWAKSIYYGDIFSSPAVAHDSVYIGANNRFYCLNALDGSEIFWFLLKSNEIVHSSPAIIEDGHGFLLEQVLEPQNLTWKMGHLNGHDISKLEMTMMGARMNKILVSISMLYKTLPRIISF